ncbi:hypothetical protein NMY22_g12805 [Coprinellus aureogranulatus]|nr:hypothetical protein NMY22_g12805 [Coprinellus aureogranulatus]
MISSVSTIKTDSLSVRATRRPSAPYIFRPNNRHWTKPCGIYCPSKERCTIGDDAVASFLWNVEVSAPASRYEDVDYLLAETALVWRFSIRCRNVKCRNYAPSDRPQSTALGPDLED